MIHRLLLIALLLPFVSYSQKRPAKQSDVKIQKTSLTRDHELQLGKEAAAQVEREMEVVKSPDVEAWLNQIGQQLAKTPQANAYPYYFKLVNEDSINAFALPGVQCTSIPDSSRPPTTKVKLRVCWRTRCPT